MACEVKVIVEGVEHGSASAYGSLTGDHQPGGAQRQDEADKSAQSGLIPSVALTRCRFSAVLILEINEYRVWIRASVP